MTTALRKRASGQRAPRRPRRALTWLARIGSAMLAVALLMLAAYSFVERSLPYHTPQFVPPRVRLTAQETAVVAHYPKGVAAVPVLTWRDISDHPGDLLVGARQFAADLAVLRRDGFHSVSLNTLQRLVDGRQVTLPSRPIILAFDDGLATDWTTVDPILRRYGFDGVVFIDPHQIALKSPSYFLTREELAAMAASGRWEVGVQMPLPRLLVRVRRGSPKVPQTMRAWRAHVASEAAQASSTLEGVTGHQVTAFAWPISLLRGPTELAVPAELDPTLRKTFPLLFGRPAGGPATFVVAGDRHLQLPRMNVTEDDTLRTLSARLREGIPGPPPANPASLPWVRDGNAKCAATGHRLRIHAAAFALCTVQANGSAWRSYDLRFVLNVRGVHTAGRQGPTALAELRLGTSGQIEIAIGRSVVTVNQRVGHKWSVLRTISVPTGIPLPGQLPPLLGSRRLQVSLKISSRVLVVRVGQVRFRLRVSTRIRDGVIGLGLLPAGHVRAITFTKLAMHRGALIAPADDFRKTRSPASQRSHQRRTGYSPRAGPRGPRE